MIKILKALPLVVVLAAGAANANTQTVTSPLGSSVSSNTFFHLSPLVSSSFSDILNFNVAGVSVLSGTFSELHNTWLGPRFFGFYYYDVNNIAVKLPGSIDFVRDTTSRESFTFTAKLPSAGTYHLDISGNTVGLVGGRYKVELSAVPVPEPESYAMLLAGLGLMGTIARRRSKSKVV